MKKILILSANPKDTSKLRLDEEVREIQAALKRARNREQFAIVTEWAIRVDDLRRALLDHQPTIIHFSGHGSEGEGLALENNLGQMQLVSTESLARLFKLFQNTIECVLLNACYSEAQAKAIHEHIDYVIGMNRAIGDKAAIEFAVGFYDALGAGSSYEDCFEVGCTSIDLEGIPESATPVLKARRRNFSFPTQETEINTTLGDTVLRESPAQEAKYNGGIPQSTNGGQMYGGIQPSLNQGSVNVSGVQGSVSGIAAAGQNQNMTGVAIGQISGAVTNTIGQLQASDAPEAPKLADLLQQLQVAIESDADLSEEDKAEALEQVKVLAEVGKAPQEGAMKKTAKRAITMLKGIFAGLPTVATLAEASSQLLPVISSLFGLG